MDKTNKINQRTLQVLLSGSCYRAGLVVFSCFQSLFQPYSDSLLVPVNGERWEWHRSSRLTLSNKFISCWFNLHKNAEVEKWKDLCSIIFPITLVLYNKISNFNQQALQVLQHGFSYYSKGLHKLFPPCFQPLCEPKLNVSWLHITSYQCRDMRVVLIFSQSSQQEIESVYFPKYHTIATRLSP